MFSEELEKLRAELYELMELKVDYALIVKKSQELDKKITESQKELMKKKRDIPNAKSRLYQREVQHRGKEKSVCKA